MEREGEKVIYHNFSAADAVSDHLMLSGRANLFIHRVHHRPIESYHRKAHPLKPTPQSFQTESRIRRLK